MTKKYLLAVAAALLVGAPPTQAQTWEYHFGTLLSGTAYQPTTTFAQLSVSTTNSMAFNFVLRTFDTLSGGTLGGAFGTSAFIAKAVFNSVSGADPISITNVQTNGAVSTIALGSTAPNVGGVSFDFYDCFGGNGTCSHGGALGRLENGESVSWTLNFAAPQVPLLGTPPVAIHVAGWGTGPNGSGSNSAWYTPMVTPVPEPETYAMLLAGLGLMGFVARRRRNALAR